MVFVRAQNEQQASPLEQYCVCLFASLCQWKTNWANCKLCSLQTGKQTHRIFSSFALDRFGAHFVRKQNQEHRGRTKRGCIMINSNARTVLTLPLQNNIDPFKGCKLAKSREKIQDHEKRIQGLSLVPHHQPTINHTKRNLDNS